MIVLKKLILIILFSLLLFSYATITKAVPIAFIKSDPIKISTHQWSSQLVGAQIVGMLFEMVGEKVDYVGMDSLSVYESMCEGEVDIVHEIWGGAMGPYFEKELNKNCVVDLATHEAKVREGWWYPNYVKDMCPGLPDWEALNSCSKIFATKETDSMGRFVAGPSFWEKKDSKRIEALNMNFIEVNFPSLGDMLEELKVSIEEKKPIVIFNWTPNLVEALYGGEFVEFPKYSPDCIKDESWGVNPTDTYDCGNPLDGYIKLGVNKDFEKNYPRAYRVAKKISFTNLDIASMGNYVDTDGYEIDFAAEEWLDINEDRWMKWIE